MVKPILERSGLRAGTDFFLGFSPEREDPGNEKFDTRDIPKIVGADDKHSRDLLAQFYACIVTRAVPPLVVAAGVPAKVVKSRTRMARAAV